jgi:hypothetical protein
MFYIKKWKIMSFSSPVIITNNTQKVSFIDWRKPSTQWRPPIWCKSLTIFGPSYLGLFGFIAPKALNFLAFQSFDFECTWWRLFQKCVVHTKSMFLIYHIKLYPLYHQRDKEYTNVFTNIFILKKSLDLQTLYYIKISFSENFWELYLMVEERFRILLKNCDWWLRKEQIVLRIHPLKYKM